MRSVVLSEGETGVQVLSEESSFLVGFKILQDSLIDFRLQFFAILRNLLFLTRQISHLCTYRLAALCEEVATALHLALSKRRVGYLRDINSRDVDLGAGRDSVGLVDTLNWDAVDLVGSGDEEES